MASPNTTENSYRPPSPSEEDCCGNGCNSCIFDIHKKLLEEWQKIKYDKLNLPPDKNYLSLTRYSRFIVAEIAKASEDCIFIELDCGLENEDTVIFLFPSQHIIMKLSSTSKPYTPISWDQKRMKLLIKLYPDGKASSCIKQLKVGDELFVRGPYGDFKYQRNSFKHIIMFSIGTGIAAIYPLAVSIINDELEDTKIDMISGFQSYSHIPLIDKLRLLTDYWNFECTICLSQESSASITGIKIVCSRINEKLMEKILDSYSPESSLILICGTEQFNESTERFIKEKQFSHYHVFR